MSATIKIKILEPKARGLLLELEHLGLIEIIQDTHQDVKAQYLKKLSGKNILDIDPKDLN